MRRCWPPCIVCVTEFRVFAPMRMISVSTFASCLGFNGWR